MFTKLRRTSTKCQNWNFRIFFKFDRFELTGCQKKCIKFPTNQRFTPSGYEEKNLKLKKKPTTTAVYEKHWRMGGEKDERACNARLNTYWKKPGRRRQAGLIESLPASHAAARSALFANFSCATSDAEDCGLGTRPNPVPRRFRSRRSVFRLSVRLHFGCFTLTVTASFRRVTAFGTASRAMGASTAKITITYSSVRHVFAYCTLGK